MKPPYRRTDDVEPAEHGDTIAGNGLRFRSSEALFHRRGELDISVAEASAFLHATRELRGGQAARIVNRADDPAIDDGIEQLSDGGAVLVTQNAGDRNRAAVRGARGEVIGEHARGGFVVGDVEDPFDGAGDGVEATRQLHAEQGARDDVFRESIAEAE